MNTVTKYLSAFLAVLMLMQAAILPVMASDAEKTTNQAIKFDPSVYSEDPELLPRNTQPAETTASAEPLPEETVSTETIPEETVPEETEPAYIEYTSVPLYFQNDYPEDMFGVGTVATSGCSITCLAMVATYLTGHEYLPDELARYFGGRAENNMERMLYGMRKMKLPYYEAENWHVVMDALAEDCVVILLLDDRSIFTDTQHFVVLTGLGYNGTVMVQDSNRDNYERWDLKDKLINGFPESDLWPGFNGAWVFDKSRMPEKPYLYHEEQVEVEPRYVGVTLTMDEREMLARMVWVEARGEPLEGQQAVAEVVLNRLVSGKYQSSVESIIMAEGQFNSARFLDKAKPYQAQYEAVERALKGPYILPMNAFYFGQYPTRGATVWGKIGGHYFCTLWSSEED